MDMVINDPRCPQCSRPLELVSQWDVVTLEGDEHTRASGHCEVHGLVEIRRTEYGGWVKQKREK